MAPEQVLGGRVGPASDLYSLGVVLFEMRTGRLPFLATTPRAAAVAHLTLDPPSPGSLAPVEERWERAILRLLSKHPKQRFATGHEVMCALEGRGEPAATARYRLPAQPDAFVGRSRELLLLEEALEGPNTRTRLLTLLGPGGAGKTRLATSYGWSSLNRWPGKIWF